MRDIYVFIKEKVKHLMLYFSRHGYCLCKCNKKGYSN